MKLDKVYGITVGVLLVVSLVLSARRNSSVPQGTAGGGEPTYPQYVELDHPLAPISLVVEQCDTCSEPLVPADPTAALKDTALDGRLVIYGTDHIRQTLAVRVYAGGPVLTPPEPPDPAVQKTYPPETRLDIPRDQDCVVWFGPYLQAVVRWDYTPNKRVLITGRWHRKTYVRRS